MEGLVKQAENFAKSAPVLPFQWTGVSYKGLKSFSQQSRDKTLKWFGLNREWKFTKAEDAFQQKMNSWIGLPSSWSNDDYDTLDQMARWGNSSFMSKSIEVWQKNSEWLSLSDSKWKTSLEKRLASEVGKKALKNAIPSLKDNVTRNSSFKDTFEDDTKANVANNRKALHMLMWWDDAIQYVGWKKLGSKDGLNWAISYSDLTNNVYRKQTETPTE